MRRTQTLLRCVPRYGYNYADVRTIEVELPPDLGPAGVQRVAQSWFTMRGMSDAVFAIEQDEDGPFAIVNDEAYLEDWGRPLL